MKRLAAMQDWPVFRVRAVTPTWTADSKSALGMTMNGSLPPSSRTLFLIWRAATKHLPERKIPRHDREHRSHWFVANKVAGRLRRDFVLGQKALRVFGIEAAALRAFRNFFLGRAQ